MYKKAEKSQENKIRAIAYSVAQNKGDGKQGFGFVDNRSEAIAQKKLQEGVSFIKVGNKSFDYSSTIQMVTGKNKKSSPYLADLKKVAKSKGALKHKRARTTYSYLNKSGKKGQGPHTSSHVGTAVALETAGLRGRDLGDVLNSKLVPRPRQITWLINQGLKKSGAQGNNASLRKKKTALLMLYRKLYRDAEGGDKRAIGKLMELAPTQTYKWKEGIATAAEMAGKGERRNVAADDIEKFYSMKKGDAIPKGSKTVDAASLSVLEARYVADRVRQLGQMALSDEELSEASFYSDTDSEVSMDDD
ncbi:hypothetical protein [Pectobacterium versatile]|uniref:hypothetical protein n=1 Tax=Pectobacterium versatile TaxID=2488639 RepID=UPI001CF18F6A|nr:hypothetical protein [Pectobacterium versatile]MCA6924663.1 hypothetical protein [Pectobacterium versatile]MCH5081427.1 hypothetical protein [Pectobacterium versatile]